MHQEESHPAEIRSDEANPFVRPPDWLLAILLVTATFLAYHPVWYGLPIWDDWRHMTPTALATWKGLKRVWLDPVATRRFDPLVDTVFWIEKRCWGSSTLGYHLISIGCHATSALLLVPVLRRLDIKGAWLAAAIFALHPVHAESVAWISELKNTLSGVFFLGATLIYLNFDKARTPSSYAFSLGLFLCALLSKTTTVVWPIGMLIVLWWRHRVLSWKRDVLPLIPFAVIAFLDGWVALGIERGIMADAVGDVNFSLVQRLAIAGHAVWFYLSKLFWPIGLYPIYLRWQITPLATIDYLYPISILILFVGVWLLRRRSIAPLAALLFFVVALSPLIGMFSFSYQRYSFVADHFQYLASLGIITLVGGGSVWLQRRWSLLARAAARVVCYVALSTLAVLTWQHSRAFTDFGSFAQTILAKYPDNWAAHDDLGVVLASQKKWPEAMSEFHKALLGNPKYVLAHYDLGAVLQEQGRLDEATREYQEALRWQPHAIAVRYNLGCLLASQGKFAAAIDQYQSILRQEPDDVEARNNLGTALASLGRGNEAIVEFHKAIEIEPDFAEAQANLGHALANQNQFAEAIQHYVEAVRLDPKNPGDHYALAIALANTGEFEQAVEQFREAARLNPDLPDVHNALARVLEKQGLHDEAQREFAEAERRETAASRDGTGASSTPSP